MSIQFMLTGIDWQVTGRRSKDVKRELFDIRYAFPSWTTMQRLTKLNGELYNMARKRTNTVDAGKGDGSFRFINVSVSEDVYEDIMDRYADGDALMDAFQTYMEVGYKFGFAYNSQNELVICSMTDRRVDSKTLNACLTGGADSWYDALKVTLYKHEVLLRMDWSTHEGGMIQKRKLL